MYAGKGYRFREGVISRKNLLKRKKEKGDPEGKEWSRRCFETMHFKTGRHAEPGRELLIPLGGWGKELLLSGGGEEKLAIPGGKGGRARVQVTKWKGSWKAPRLLCLTAYTLSRKKEKRSQQRGEDKLHLAELRKRAKKGISWVLLPVNNRKWWARLPSQQTSGELRALEQVEIGLQ